VKFVGVVSFATDAEMGRFVPCVKIICNGDPAFEHHLIFIIIFR